jgi:hypothetical protein
MKISELIEILQKYPQDLTVIIPEYGDFDVIETSNINLLQLPTPDGDGWIYSGNSGKPLDNYLCIG